MALISSEQLLWFLCFQHIFVRTYKFYKEISLIPGIGSKCIWQSVYHSVQDKHEKSGKITMSRSSQWAALSDIGYISYLKAIAHLPMGFCKCFWYILVRHNYVLLHSTMLHAYLGPFITYYEFQVLMSNSEVFLISLTTTILPKITEYWMHYRIYIF